MLRVTGVMHNDQNQGQDRYPEPTPLADHYSAGESATLPAVSVVMPVLNEEKHLAESVAAVLGQEYPGGFELVLAMGPARTAPKPSPVNSPPPTAGSPSYSTRPARSPRP